MDHSSEKATATYTHKPLENAQEQIRLLTIIPSRDNNSIIDTRMSIHNFPLSHLPRRARLWAHLGLPPYTTVSHVWATGAQSVRDHDILINNKRFTVTSNIYAALHQYPEFASTPLCYWIDSICINQVDDDEKAKQIPLMCEIYSTAAIVSIWLGPGTPETNKALRFVNKLTFSPLLLKASDAFLKLVDVESERKRTGRKQTSLAYMVYAEAIWIVYAILMILILRIPSFIYIASDVYLGRPRLSMRKIADLGEVKTRYPSVWQEIKTSFMEEFKTSFMEGFERGRQRRANCRKQRLGSEIGAD